MAYTETRFLLSERNNPNAPVRSNGVRFWGHPDRTGGVGAITCIVVHTTENAPGPGVALNVARWQASTAPAPSSYHAIVDTRDVVRTLEDRATAFHAVGVNTRGLGLSFATRANMWGRNVAADRAMLERGAQVARAWSNRYSIPLRWLTKAEADRGVRGFVRHSTVDPTRRSDPGPGFPASLFFRLAAGVTAAAVSPEEDDMTPADLYKSKVPGTDESFALHQRHTLVHLRWLRSTAVPALFDALEQATKAAEAAASGDSKTAAQCAVDAGEIAKRVRRELAEALE